VASQSIYYAKNIVSAAAGTNLVTVTFATPAAFPDIRIAEYSGADLVNPVDVTAANSGSSTSSSSGSATTTNATDLLFGANLVQTITTGAGSGFTRRLLTSPDGDIVEDRMVSATGAYSATAPIGPSGKWIMQMVAFRTPVSGGDTQPPTAPANLAATAAGMNQINLGWTASTDNVGVRGYLVERCQGAGCNNFVQIGTTTGTTYNDTGLTANTSYSYRVRATDAAGNLSSYSNITSATTLGDTQPPTAPSNLTATAPSSSQINLSWTASSDNVGVTGYLVERCQGVGCNNFAQVGTATSIAFNDTGLTANSSYSYRVRATDSAGNLSSYSNVASTTTQASDTQPPTAPSNLGATATSSSQSTLSWTASTDNVGVTGYLVERCQGVGCNNFAQVGTAASVAFNDTGLAANTSYSYRVRATDAAGNLSSYSNVASASTSANTGLVAAYSFDEGAGTTVVDSSGQGNNGAVTNEGWAAGKFGNALVFNGTSSLVTIADKPSLDLTSGMTLEAWVNPSVGTSAWRDVIYKGDDRYYLEGSSTNSSRPAGGGTWGTTGVAISGTGALSVNTWSYLALTYDGANLRLYVNGTQVASQARTGNLAPSTNPLQIGGDSIYGQYFQGLIDEVRVYKVPLSVSQIQADMITPIGSLVDTQAPTAPTNLAATTTSGSQINLNWTASTDNVGVTGYLIERCQGAGCTFGQIGTTAGTTYNDTGLTASTGYSYRVRATDAAGSLSPYSNVASATTQTSDTQPPMAPTNLAATAINGTQINLSWTASTDNVGVTGYLVERCQGAGCSNFAQIGTIAATTYNDTGVTASTAYSYRMRATDAAGNLSPYSNVANATTQASDTQPPTAPTNMVATASSGSQINLSWTASTDNLGVTGYLIERCQGVGCSNWARVLTVPGTAYSDSGLLPNTSYSYRVKATDGAGNFSPYSNVSTTTTLPTIPGLMAAYSFDEGTGTTVSDLSGNGNTGTIANATWTSSAVYGNALRFNGSNSLVTIKDSPSLHLASGMTLEAWVNPSITTNGWRDVIYKGNDNYFLEGTSGNNAPAGGVLISGADVITYGTSPLMANSWTHVALTFDGAMLRLYVNGGQVVSLASAGAITTSTNPLQIGGDSLFGQYFSGTIDEVRVYNQALTQAQIQSDMATAVGGGGSQPLVSLSSNNINFGSVQTGVTSSPQSVTLRNTGGATLIINSITVSGGNTGDFAETDNCEGTLATASSCNVNVTFMPATTGPRASSVIISDNAPGTPHTIALSGTGIGFAVLPRVAVLTPTMTQQFTAGGGVTWSVDGIDGGSSSSGIITSAGLYSPPTNAGTHTVSATTTNPPQSASAAVYVTNYPGTFTHHNDNLRTGQNTSETVLSPANVTQTQFGKLFSFALDGIAFASPLYIANVNVPAKGFHNVVYVATEHDSVYAWDADGLSPNPLWKVTFLKSGVTTVPCGDTGECGDIPNEIGITGTPAIDQASGTIYVVAKTKEGTKYVQRLHALDITTGAEKFGGPITIQASVAGSGDGSQGGQLPLDPLRENQRPALVLSNGSVYIGWASHGDQRPWHGWVVAYNATTLVQTATYCATPDGSGGGIWLSGGGLGADPAGNIYLTTGNGDFTANTSGRDYGDSVVKLNSGGSVVDYFTPFDQDVMDSQNFDLSSAGPVLLVDQPGNFPHEMITAAKTGTIYVINRDNMGHFHSGSDSQIIQSLPGVLPHGAEEQGNYSAPAFFNGNVYFAAVNDNLKAFQLSNGFLSDGPTSHSLVIYPNRGGAFAVSASGSTNGIVWAVQDNNPNNGILHAYDANNLANEFYNTSQAGSRDTLGVATKFSIPLVANGKVFVGAQTQIVVYGLLP
jgi:chitodextrinase